MQDLIERAAQAIRTARQTIALTGAGISAESGIPTFRDPGGLWDRYDPEEYATIEAFRRDPGKVWRMVIEINPEHTDLTDWLADLIIQEKAGIAIPQIIAAIKAIAS